VPVRFRRLIAALKRMRVVAVVPVSGGSHWRCEESGVCYPIPAHNGDKSEISDAYIRGVSRALELDEAKLRALL
jgi:hypothetical protein